MRYFTVFCRVALAAGFLPAGMVKILGERFTDLSNNHPMGHYLEAVFHTGYYYTFIGIAQVMAALLLLIPRTATLGALLYFPIILNICILSLATRFDGSAFTSPMMVLANLYLICWDYDKLKYIIPAKHPDLPHYDVTSKKFPFAFLGTVALIMVLCVFIQDNIYTLKPRNHIKDCQKQCGNAQNPNACYTFCDCIHNQGKPLDKSLDEYDKAVKSNK